MPVALSEEIQMRQWRKMVIVYPEGFGNLLSAKVTSIWSTIWLTSGIGWFLASRFSDTSMLFKRVGFVCLAAGVLSVAAGVLFGHVPWEVSYTMLSVAWAFAFANVLRYFVWSQDWEPVRRIQSCIGESRIRYDVPEVVFLAVAWLVSLSSIGKGFFTGLPEILWNIGGSISVVRTFDLPAAIGIGATPIVRLIALWLGRVTIVIAVILRFAL